MFNVPTVRLPKRIIDKKKFLKFVNNAVKGSFYKSASKDINRVISKLNRDELKITSSLK